MRFNISIHIFNFNSKPLYCYLRILPLVGCGCYSCHAIQYYCVYYCCYAIQFMLLLLTPLLLQLLFLI